MPTDHTIVLRQRDYDRLFDIAASALDASATGRALMEELEHARVVPDGALPPGVVAMGSLVEYRDEQTGEHRTVQLVYPGDQDVEAGRISVFTPVGAALIGLAPGQSIGWATRDGKRKNLTVVRVGQSD
jgi:regulator of nucleoside diphosphate kinase